MASLVGLGAVVTGALLTAAGFDVPQPLMSRRVASTEQATKVFRFTYANLRWCSALARGFAKNRYNILAVQLPRGCNERVAGVGVRGRPTSLDLVPRDDRRAPTRRHADGYSAVANQRSFSRSHELLPGRCQHCCTPLEVLL